MKRKISLIVGLLLIINFTMIGCSNNADSGDKSSTEKFKKTTVYNPNTTKVKLIAVSSSRAAEGDEVCEVEPLKSKEVDLGNEHDYYFTDKDGNKIADLSKSDSGEYLPVYLELNEPKDGKQYMLLNQFKKANYLESYPRNNNEYNTYGLLLYEVVTKNDLDAYKYDDDTYIRIYPSGNYWLDSESYASNKIGTIITYNEEFKNNFTPRSNSWVAWGWSTKNTELNMWFCHRVVSSILHVVNDGGLPVKEVGQKIDVTYYNPTDKDIKIYDYVDQVKSIVRAGSIATEKIYLNNPFYFMDGTDKVEIYLENAHNFFLGLEKPVAGKKYMCLSQGKTSSVENDGEYYGITLFEIVDETAEYSNLYSNGVYVRTYPSARYWIKDENFANKYIGKEITYNNDIFSQFTVSYKSSCWGWSTKKDDVSYEHFISKIIYEK